MSGKKILHYWQEALNHFDLSALAKHNAITCRFSLTESPGDHAPIPMAPVEVPQHYRPGRCGWWLILFTEGHGGGQRRSPNVLLGVPLAIADGENRFVPPTDARPRLNRNWMEPANPYDRKNGYFCTVESYDDWFAKNPLNVDADAPDWSAYWHYVERMVEDLTGQPAIRIHHAAGEDRTELSWKVVADQGGNNGGQVAAIAAAIDGKAPLLWSCVDPASIEPLRGVEELDEARRRHLAHMDTYDAEHQGRKGYALESSQRRAVQHLQLVPDGRLLAVNGPPGTGKTSFLRSVIASIWVQAALDGGSSPLILATAYTNKAVTNIIESFAAIPGPAMQAEWESRWLPNLPSYGWFHPAKSQLQDKWDRYMALRPGRNRHDAMIADGAAAGFFAEAQSGTDAMKRDFLRLHADCVGLTFPLTSVEGAAADIQGRLQRSVQDMHAMQERFDVLFRARQAVQETWGQERQKRGQLRDIEQVLHQTGAVLAEKQQQLAARQAERTELLETWRAYRNQLQGEELERRARIMAAEVRASLQETSANEEGGGEGFFAALFGRKNRARERQSRRERQERIRARLDQIATAPLMETPPPGDLAPIDRSIADIRAELSRLQREIEDMTGLRGRIERFLKPLVDFRLLLSETIESMRTLRMPDTLLEKLPDLDTWEGLSAIPGIWDGVEEEMDVRYRFRHFHMAARYWEARWLAKPLRGKTQTGGAHQEHLRHMAMLAPVIVATTHTLPKVRGDGPYAFADILIFDEAGQAMPEFGCPAFALARRAIVVGDIYQLEPIWNLTESDEQFLLDRVGLGRLDQAYSAASGSVMQVAQRATAFGLPDPERERPAGIPLMAHYRCRETIIGYCRELIYHEDLRPMRKDESAQCPYPPMTWVAVEDSAAQRMNSSWSNEREADEIVGWLADEKDRLISQYQNPDIAQIVAIIAPFRAQADLIRVRVGKHPGLGQEIAKTMTINTVHALQGAEMPVVAFSVTQTQPPFFANGSPVVKPNMLNVAVSRAQDAFVLFASPEVLRAVANDTPEEPLALLVDYLHRKGQRLYPRELVIIESPQKAEHITRALGRTARILATEGHFLEIADWPKGKEPQWTENNTEFPGRLAAALQDAGQLDWLVLATDDDRDGEEIAWHVLRYVERLSPRLVARTVRMRFHDLTPGTLRQARAMAQPGVDLRRVQASILKRLADYRFTERTRTAVGHGVGRNQMATMAYLETPSIPEPQRYQVVLHGTLADQPVKAYVVSSASATAPALWVDQKTALQQVRILAAKRSLPVQAVLSVERDFPPFPPQTTARFMISGWRRYGWRPQESAQHLQNLYWGRYNTTIKAAGDPA